MNVLCRLGLHSFLKDTACTWYLPRGTLFQEPITLSKNQMATTGVHRYDHWIHSWCQRCMMCKCGKVTKDAAFVGGLSQRQVTTNSTAILEDLKRGCGGFHQ